MEDFIIHKNCTPEWITFTFNNEEFIIGSHLSYKYDDIFYTQCTPLMYIIASYKRLNYTDNVFKTYLSENRDFINKSNYNGDTPLMIACARRYTNLIKILLDLGAHPNAKNNITGNTALIEIMRVYHNNMITPDIIKQLIDCGVDVDTQNNYGVTALMIICQKHKIDISVVKLLLESNINPNLTDDKGNTALHYECLNLHRSSEIVQLLLDRGADIKINSNILFDISYNISNNNKMKTESIIQILINANYDITLKDTNGFTALIHFTTRKYEKIAEILINATTIFDPVELVYISICGTEENLKRYYSKFKEFSDENILSVCIQNSDKHKQLLSSYLHSLLYKKLGYDEKLIGI